MTDLQERHIQAIQEDYPELLIHDASLNSHQGQYNDLLIINHQIIFRFPKFKDGLITLRREVSLLELLQSMLTLEIPRPVYLSSDTETIGRVFMGYHKIKGEPLWHPRFQAIKDQQVLAKMASQLATFLRELHAIPVDNLNLDLPFNDRPQDWEKLYEEIRRYLFSKIRSEARRSISNKFESFLLDPELHRFEPALRHGDFGSGNILYDQADQSISGIIDFGSAGLGDPAIDIAAAMTFGESFFNHYYSSYPGLSALIKRAKFYKSTFALQEALHGLKHNDHEAFERGIAPYT
jgi:aminoglycoside 2''-phosphotransferase